VVRFKSNKASVEGNHREAPSGRASVSNESA
jgi:hypothetical protein